jgi:hypothetical protein
MKFFFLEEEISKDEEQWIPSQDAREISNIVESNFAKKVKKLKLNRIQYEPNALGLQKIHINLKVKPII